MENFELIVFGINHQKADVELREKAAFSPESIPSLLETMTKAEQIAEAVVLSTCNRSEIYAFAAPGQSVKNLIKSYFLKYCHALTETDLMKFYFYEGQTALNHLFHVASGLNSMVLGEPQIVGQVKDAFRAGLAAGTVKTHLNRMFNIAFQTAKRIHAETTIGEGAVSVAYAAVELAQKVFKDLGKQTVLLIGAGETGELVMQHLKKKGVSSFYIVNRTPEKAEKLASRFGGKTGRFDDLNAILPEVDLIIGSTSARKYILTKEDVRKVLPAKSSRPLFMIDIAVPRDFDPAINQLNNVFLNDIDSLEQIVLQNIKKRKQELPLAENMIEEGIHNYHDWRNSLTLTPTIVALREKFELIRDAELEKYRHQTNDEEYEKIQQATRGILNKILHVPMVQLKQYQNGKMNVDGMIRIDVLREIFDLENPHE